MAQNHGTVATHHKMVKSSDSGKLRARMNQKEETGHREAKGKGDNSYSFDSVVTIIPYLKPLVQYVSWKTIFLTLKRYLVYIYCMLFNFPVGTGTVSCKNIHMK